MSILFKRIETLCKFNSISITTMCKEAGVSRASLSDLKVGRKQTLSSLTLDKIANYFDTTVDYLLGRTDDPEGSDRFGIDPPELWASNSGHDALASFPTTTQKIDKILQERGMSRKQLAINAKIPPEELESELNKGDPINIKMLYAISDVLSIHPFSIMDFDQATARLEDYVNNVLIKRLLYAFSKLNDLGKEIAIERLEELVEIPKYKETYVEETDDTTD